MRLGSRPPHRSPSSSPDRSSPLLEACPRGTRPASTAEAPDPKRRRGPPLLFNAGHFYLEVLVGRRTEHGHDTGKARLVLIICTSLVGKWSLKILPPLAPWTAQRRNTSPGHPLVACPLPNYRSRGRLAVACALGPPFGWRKHLPMIHSPGPEEQQLDWS